MIYESLWARGCSDTIKAAKSFPGLIVEVGGTALIGVLTQDPWITIYFLIFCLVVLWIVATGTAPIRQRDEEREARRVTEEELTALKLAKAPSQRRLTPSQTQEISDLIAKYTNGEEETVVLSFGNEECIDFADDFVKALRNGGLVDAHSTTMAFSGPIKSTLRDIEILYWVNSDMTLVHALSDLLTKFGLVHKLKSTDRADTSPFRIIINRPSK